MKFFLYSIRMSLLSAIAILLLVGIGNADSLTITSIKVRSEKTLVYNFEVTEAHTYFVAEQKYLVHNNCGAENTATWVTQEASDVLSPGNIARIQNAADRIDRPIHLIGSRASGKAGPASDWDYDIPGLTNSEWKKIKNSLPGSERTHKDGLWQRNLDVFKDDPFTTGKGGSIVTFSPGH